MSSDVCRKKVLTVIIGHIFLILEIIKLTRFGLNHDLRLLYNVSPMPLFVLQMFIGGLSWNTNDSMLYHHFSKFGEVVEHCVMRDAATQRSRGFGFVKFADADAVERVGQTFDTTLIFGNSINQL